MDFLFLCFQWSWNFRLWKSWEGQCCAAGNESVECVHPRGRLHIDLSSKCSILQAQLLSNWPRSQQLQYLPEHSMHHIQVPGHNWDLLCRAQKLWGPWNTLVISLRCRKSRKGQRQKAFGYIRQKKKKKNPRLFDYEMLTSGFKEGIVLFPHNKVYEQILLISSPFLSLNTKHRHLAELCMSICISFHSIPLEVGVHVLRKV